jgi:hypothetical protein
MHEKRFQEIERTLRNHRANYRTDCDEADDYRRDMAEMIEYVKRLRQEIHMFGLKKNNDIHIVLTQPMFDLLLVGREVIIEQPDESRWHISLEAENTNYKCRNCGRDYSFSAKTDKNLCCTACY